MSIERYFQTNFSYSKGVISSIKAICFSKNVKLMFVSIYQAQNEVSANSSFEFIIKRSLRSLIKAINAS